jgi:hypothetical protein
MDMITSGKADLSYLNIIQSIYHVRARAYDITSEHQIIITGVKSLPGKSGLLLFL